MNPYCSLHKSSYLGDLWLLGNGKEPSIFIFVERDTIVSPQAREWRGSPLFYEARNITNLTMVSASQ